MRTRAKVIIATASIAVAIVAGAGMVLAADARTEIEVPITGTALERASGVALDRTGAGRVTETEIGDEESLYEVEVTLPDGSQVDIQLDEGFKVVGVEQDGTPDDHD